jgi:hypothetical protein
VTRPSRVDGEHGSVARDGSSSWATARTGPVTAPTQSICAAESEISIETVDIHTRQAATPSWYRVTVRNRRWPCSRWPRAPASGCSPTTARRSSWPPPGRRPTATGHPASLTGPPDKGCAALDQATRSTAWRLPQRTRRDRPAASPETGSDASYGSGSDSGRWSGSQPGMETLRPERTRRMRWLSLVMVPLMALVIAVHGARLTTVAAVLTPLAGIVIAVLGAGRSRAQGLTSSR